jgi:hypothetical protein
VPPDVHVAYRDTDRPRVRVRTDNEWIEADLIKWQQLGGHWHAEVERTGPSGPVRETFLAREVRSINSLP